MNEDRIEAARNNFLKGYNCTQSVILAWADYYNIDPQIALRMSCGFGGGMGRMRMTCGAASALVMLAGLENAMLVGGDREAKARNYKLVQELAGEFKKQHGSLICSQLLGLDKPEGTYIPAERTQEYYKKRPCKEIVASASAIFVKYIASKDAETEVNK